MFYPGKSLSNSITASKVVFTHRNVAATSLYLQPGHILGLFHDAGIVSLTARAMAHHVRPDRRVLKCYGSVCQVFVKTVTENVELLIAFN